jgi:hypothetical protein
MAAENLGNAGKQIYLQLAASGHGSKPDLSSMFGVLLFRTLLGLKDLKRLAQDYCQVGMHLDFVLDPEDFVSVP